MPSTDVFNQGRQIIIEDADEVQLVIAEAMALYKRKDQKYGKAWRSQGYTGNVARVLSKVSRLKNMLWRDDPISDSEETVEDTLLDLINLAAFTIINIRENNRWGN